MIANNPDYSNDQRLTVLTKLIQQLKPDNSLTSVLPEKNHSQTINDYNFPSEEMKSKGQIPSNKSKFSLTKVNPKLEYAIQKKFTSFSKTMTQDWPSDNNKNIPSRIEKSPKSTLKNSYKIESPVNLHNLPTARTSNISTNLVHPSNQTIKQDVIGDFLRRNLELDGSAVNDQNLAACNIFF